MRVLLEPSEDTMTSLRNSWKNLLDAGFDYTSALMQRTLRDCMWELVENTALAYHADHYERDQYYEDVYGIIMSDWGETADMIESLQIEMNHLIDMDTELGKSILNRADHYDWDSEMVDMFTEVVISFMPELDVILPAATSICESMTRIGIAPERLEMLQFDRTGRYLIAEVNDD